MATQGIVSIVNKDKVLLKVVAGCDGYNAKKLITRLFNNWPVTPEEAYKAAQEEKFGCNACLFVITEHSILGLNSSHELDNFERTEDADFDRYRETFQKPRFNPRWAPGTADYVFVLDIANKEKPRPKRLSESCWVCQVRPASSPRGGNVGPGDFFRPEKVTYLTFEEGIQVVMYSPHSDTIIVENRGFCVVKKSFKSVTKTRTSPITGEEHTYTTRDPNILCVCLPDKVRGREVVFSSLTINPLTIR